MRALPMWFAGFAATLATVASACPVYIPAGPRSAESLDYDRQYCQWRRALGERIAGDADPDVAWTGAAMAVRDDCGDGRRALASLPPSPTTGGGRLMQLVYAEATNGASGVLAQWRTVDPGNLYLAALAVEIGEAVGDQHYAEATHYDDHYLDVARLVATIVARYDLTPPPKPQDYIPLTVPALLDGDPADLVFPTTKLHATLEGLVSSQPVKRAPRLKFADLLVAAEGTPFAAEEGAKIGADAAVEPGDRARWCRYLLRVQNAAEASWELSRTDLSTPQSQEFHALLRERNAMDAIDAIAARLPLNLRPQPVDETLVARCIERGPGFEGDAETAEDEATAIASSD